MEKANSNDFQRITVKRKNPIFYRTKKFALQALGVLLMLFGAVICLTIVGIPFGIGMMGSGVGLIFLGAGWQAVDCPSCRSKKYLLKTNDSFDCKRCNARVLVDWIEPA